MTLKSKKKISLPTKSPFPLKGKPSDQILKRKSQTDYLQKEFVMKLTFRQGLMFGLGLASAYGIFTFAAGAITLALTYLVGVISG